MAYSLSEALANSSMLLKLAFIGFVVTLVLHVVGFATNHWMYVHEQSLNVATGTSQGLWSTCVCNTYIWHRPAKETCVCARVDLSTTSWLTCVQVLETVGLASLSVAVLFVTLQISTDVKRNVKHAAMFLGVAAGINILAGIIVYAAQQTTAARYLHYSFGVCTVAAIGSFFSVVILFADSRSRGTPTATPAAQFTEGGVVVSPPTGHAYSSPVYGQRD